MVDVGVVVLPEVTNNKELEEMFMKEVSQLILIKDMPALFRVSISHFGELAVMSNSNYCRTVVNALNNLRA